MRHEQWIKVYSHTQYSVLSDMKTVGECTDTRTYQVRWRLENLEGHMEVSVE